MTETGHKDPSQRWLIFFFICFALVLIGIVVFFARDINKEPEVKPSGGAHGGMILPQDKQHMYQIRIV